MSKLYFYNKSLSLFSILINIVGNGVALSFFITIKMADKYCRFSQTTIN